MKLNSALAVRYPAYYNHELLVWRKQRLKLTVRQVAKMVGGYSTTVEKVFQGKATSKMVFPVVQALGLDWALVHDLTLPEIQYHQAVLPPHMAATPLIPPNGSG